MSELPKRVPGALLPQPSQPPEGGWFGVSVTWPTEDPDSTAAVHYLRDSGLPDGPEVHALFDRVLDGLYRLDPPADR